MSDFKQMAELLLSDVKKTTEYYENLYPGRNSDPGAIVTRFAPSPTGFLHIGGLFAAFVSNRAALSTDGVFYLRIEDTDKKREVAGGVSLIVNGLRSFGVSFDEGMYSETESNGVYAPYIQSKRADIYRTFAKKLIEEGMAYPCFMTEDELSQIRSIQEEQKLLPGCYGKFAKYRDISYEEAKQRIENGETYVVRLKSPGKIDGKIKFKDGIRGEIEMPENIQDVVILKSDGIPTYHFAHAIDDHLMRTTDVIRGDEWVSSVPIHLQLFSVLGFKPPKYSHISPIMKEEDGGKRKLSKRKDPEAAVSYYEETGYTAEAVIEYLLTIANSNYEQWRNENPGVNNKEFNFSLSKMSKAGALFDLAKLNDISKTVVSQLNANQVYNYVVDWSKQYDNELYKILTNDPQYALSIFSIERGNEKPRKDITYWSEVKDYISYFYKDLWDKKLDFAENLTNNDMIEIIEEYKKVYNHNDTSENWFPTLRDMSEKLGYAKAPKLYKKDPDSYRGHVGDVSTVIRVAITGRRNTPDLYSIMQVLGYDEVIKRLDESIDLLKK